MPRRGALRLALGAAALLAGLTAFDLARPPDAQLSARTLIGGIHAYRASLGRVSTVIGARCRFQPSCSRYAEVAVRRHGALTGSWLTVKRIARCGPWTSFGTIDPPPT